MSKDVNDIISDIKNLSKITKEIADRIVLFQTYFEDEEKNFKTFGSLDYSFDVKEGKMVGGDRQSNTDISFDIDKKSLTYEFMKSLYEREFTEDEEKQIAAYAQLISERLIENHRDTIENFIRTSVLHGASEEAVPLDRIKVLSLELIDFSSTDEQDKHLLQFVKMPGYTVNMQAVQSALMDIREDYPTTPIKEVVASERAKGNQIFQGILDVETGDKFLWEMNLKLFVDYSFSEEFIEAQPRS